MSDTTTAPQTVAQVLDAAAVYFGGKRVEEPRLAAEHLMARLLGCKRLDLLEKRGVPLSEKLLDAMRRGTRRVAAGEPVQYVIGQWDFMGHTLKVDTRALIPRPETELLVEDVLKCEALWKDRSPAIVDMGTGSGCIIISLALARPDALYLALDVSEDALALARENAALHGLQERIAFASGELADLVEAGSVDAIVANLPYIPSADCESLPLSVRGFEPRVALDGGPTGLGVIELVIQDASMALKPDGLVFLEMGFDQAAPVQSLLKDAGFSDIAILKDLAGRDRVARGRLVG